MKKKITAKQPNAAECFVCGVDNSKGLHASFFETEEKEIVALFTPHRFHQSYPDRLHGGIAACILDETMGRAVQIGNPDLWGVTVELSLAYKKPVPYEVQLKAVGRITKENRLLFESEGEIYLPDGQIAVTAKARYVKMQIGSISENFDPDSWKVRLDIDDPSEVEI